MTTGLRNVIEALQSGVIELFSRKSHTGPELTNAFMTGLQGEFGFPTNLLSPAVIKTDSVQPTPDTDQPRQRGELEMWWYSQTDNYDLIVLGQL